MDAGINHDDLQQFFSHQTPDQLARHFPISHCLIAEGQSAGIGADFYAISADTQQCSGHKDISS